MSGSFGTANQDETTRPFADKTIDRAQVLELTRIANSESKNPGKPLNLGVQNFLNWSISLKDQPMSKSAQSIYKMLNQVLKNEFKMKLGHRFQQRVNQFVPAFEDLGGNPTAALDYMFAHKAFYKIIGRHQFVDPTEYKAQLNASLEKLKPHPELKQVKQIFENELAGLL